MTRYEYRNTTDETELAALGLEGWEAYAVTTHDSVAAADALLLQHLGRIQQWSYPITTYYLRRRVPV